MARKTSAVRWKEVLEEKGEERRGESAEKKDNVEQVLKLVLEIITETES